MIKRFIILLPIVFAFGSCSDFMDTRIYFKRIKTAKFELEWFYYSRITSDSPNYVLLSYDNKCDTLYNGGNLSDVNILVRDTSIIQLITIGDVTRVGDKILKKSKGGIYKINVDTNGVNFEHYGDNCFSE